MEKKLAICIIIIALLAGTVTFFVLKDFGFFGRNSFRLGGRLNYPAMDNNSFLAMAKNSLGLPGDATEAQVKEALNLPADAGQQQIMDALIQRGITPPKGG